MGLEWDCFIFAVESWQGDSTRRSPLSYVASLFDPLGLVASRVLPSKLPIQDLTRIKADWDETGTYSRAGNIVSVNFKMYKNLDLTAVFLQLPWKESLNRNYTLSTMHQNLAIAQLRWAGDVKCSLLMAKSRVAPLKPVTIPRMVLAGAVLSVKLVNFVKELATPLNSVTFWIDSVVVLHFIRNRSTRFDVNTSNRLSVVREHSQAEQ